MNNHQSKPVIDFRKLPSRNLAHRFVDEMMEFIFHADTWVEEKDAQEPINKQHLKAMLNELIEPLRDRIPWADTLADNFFSRLSDVYTRVIKDAAFFVQADPAAECIEEVIVAYPGFYAITIYRIANELYRLKVPILPRLITEYAHTKTGIDIHPGATIGVPFFIDHGTGIVIGQTSVIGNNVKLFQGVTLGALAVRKEEQGAKRHPTIEDNVIIYAGSCILGGDTVIGHDSVIGGNAWLTDSVLPFSVVYNKSDTRIRDKSELKEVIDYVI